MDQVQLPNEISPITVWKSYMQQHNGIENFVLISSLDSSSLGHKLLYLLCTMLQTQPLKSCTNEPRQAFQICTTQQT